MFLLLVYGVNAGLNSVGLSEAINCGENILNITFGIYPSSQFYSSLVVGLKSHATSTDISALL